MVIWTAKVTKKKLALALVGIAAVLCGIILLVSALAGSGAEASAPVAASGVSDNAARVAFLPGYGWDVAPEATESQEVLIPRKWDAVFEQYNELQKAQGFDLSKYKNKRCMRYTYEVRNYPGQPEGVRATLLVYRDKVIGGDVQSPELDGFMHGFTKP
jgi:hypothetical protein